MTRLPLRAKPGTSRAPRTRIRTHALQPLPATRRQPRLPEGSLCASGCTEHLRGTTFPHPRNRPRGPFRKVSELRPGATTALLVPPSLAWASAAHSAPPDVDPDSAETPVHGLPPLPLTPASPPVRRRHHCQAPPVPCPRAGRARTSRSSYFRSTGKRYLFKTQN